MADEVPRRRFKSGHSDYVAIEVQEVTEALIDELWALPEVVDIVVGEDEEGGGLRVLKLFREGELDMARVMSLCQAHTPVGEIKVKKEMVGGSGTKRAPDAPDGDDAKPVDLLPRGEHVEVGHYLGLRGKVQMIGSYIALSAKLWYRFKVSFIFSLLSMFIAIMIWYFLGIVLGKPLGGDYADVNYFTFVIVGIIINQYIILTLTTYLDTVREIYWENRLEIYMTSPARLNTFFVSALIWTYLYATLNVLIYFGVGIFVFGASLSIPSPVGALAIVVILLLLIIALSGIGLISASMFFLVEAKGSTEPISWFVVTITGLIAGVFYPVEIFLDHFPPLYTASKVFPQTYAVDAVRRLMIVDGPGIPALELIQTVLVLAIFAAILFPLGQYMFQFAVRKGEREGKLAKWS